MKKGLCIGAGVVVVVIVAASIGRAVWHNAQVDEWMETRAALIEKRAHYIEKHGSEGPHSELVRQMDDFTSEHDRCAVLLTKDHCPPCRGQRKRIEALREKEHLIPILEVTVHGGRDEHETFWLSLYIARLCLEVRIHYPTLLVYEDGAVTVQEQGHKHDPGFLYSKLFPYSLENLLER